MSTPNDLIAVAASQVGTKEQGKNRTKYGAWFGFNGVAWCSIFVAWCLGQVGMDPRPFIASYASCDAAYAGWKRLGRTFSDKMQIKPGTILFYRFSRKGGFSDHTGIAVSAPYRKFGIWYVDTIEGNTSGGSNTSGGMVQRRTRKLSLVVGMAWPAYTNAQAPQTPPPPPAAPPATSLPVRPYIAVGATGRAVEVAQFELALVSGYQFPPSSIGTFDLYLCQAIQNLGKVLGKNWPGDLSYLGPDQWAAIDFLVLKSGHSPGVI